MPYVEGILNYNGMIGMNQYYQIINNFENLTLNVDRTKVYIDFADAEVERIALANWDTDSNGGISMDEALAVTNIAGLFYNNTTIRTFEEFQYFTNVPSLSPQNLNTQGFSGCTNLTTIVLPPSLRMLGQSSFRNCSSLTSVNLGNVTELYNYVFQGCTNLEIDVNMPYLTRLNDAVFVDSGITSVTSLGNTITSIQGGSGSGQGVFRRCVNLQSVNLPSTVSEIGQNAFNGCTSLETINFTSSILTIGEDAFRGCSSLAINVNLPGLTTLGNNAFNSSGIKKILSLGSITTIYGNTPSGQGTFNGCTGLTEVVLPNTLTTIQAQAFRGCTALTTINFPASITTIGTNAFYQTSSMEVDAYFPNLTTLEGTCFQYSGIRKFKADKLAVVPGANTSVGGGFRWCSKLIEVDLPSTLTTINAYAFASCSALQTFIVRATTPPTTLNGFLQGTPNTMKIYVPYSSDHSILNAYKAATGWTSFASQIYELTSDGNIPT